MARRSVELLSWRTILILLTTERSECIFILGTTQRIFEVQIREKHGITVVLFIFNFGYVAERPALHSSPLIRVEEDGNDNGNP